MRHALAIAALAVCVIETSLNAALMPTTCLANGTLAAVAPAERRAIALAAIAGRADGEHGGARGPCAANQATRLQDHRARAGRQPEAVRGPEGLRTSGDVTRTRA